MMNWYRAALRLPSALPEERRVRLPTLMLWGVHHMALGREMAQSSIDLCDLGKLIFFENATHWVQHEEGTLVNALIVDFFDEGAFTERSEQGRFNLLSNLK